MADNFFLFDHIKTKRKVGILHCANNIVELYLRYNSYREQEQSMRKRELFFIFLAFMFLLLVAVFNTMNIEPKPLFPSWTINNICQPVLLIRTQILTPAYITGCMCQTRRSWTPTDTQEGCAVNIHGRAVSVPRLSAGFCHSIDLSYMTFMSNDRPASPQSWGKRCPFFHLLDVSSSRRQQHSDYSLHFGLSHFAFYCMHIGRCASLKWCILRSVSLCLSVNIDVLFFSFHASLRGPSAFLHI